MKTEGNGGTMYEEFPEGGKVARLNGEEQAILVDKCKTLRELARRKDKVNKAIDNNHNIVGRFNANLARLVNIYYKFRKNKKFDPILGEAGIGLTSDKINFDINFVKLNNLRKYYVDDETDINNNKIQQINYQISYQSLTTQTYVY